MRRCVGIVATLVALLLLGFVGITVDQVLSLGDTHIVLTAVRAHGRVPNAAMLEATRAILGQRLGAVGHIFTQPTSVQIVTTDRGALLAVDVHLASEITQSLPVRSR